MDAMNEAPASRMRADGAIARRRRSQDFLTHRPLEIRRGPPGGSSLSTQEVANGFLTAALGTLLAISGGGSSGAVMACLPLMPAWSEDVSAVESAEVSQRIRLLAHLVNGAALAQLTTAVLQFILNDPLSGLIGGGIAAIGCQTAHPAGFRLLPTYVVLSFCHGIMQVLLNLQLLASGLPLHAATAVQTGVMGKVAVGTLMASPVVMFLGMGMGYWLHKESQQMLRNLPAPVPVAPAAPIAPAVAPAPAPAADQASPSSPRALPAPAPTSASQERRPVILAMAPSGGSSLTLRPEPPAWNFGTGQRLPEDEPDTVGQGPDSPPADI